MLADEQSSDSQERENGQEPLGVGNHQPEGEGVVKGVNRIKPVVVCVPIGDDSAERWKLIRHKPDDNNADGERYPETDGAFERDVAAFALRSKEAIKLMAQKGDGKDEEGEQSVWLSEAQRGASAQADDGEHRNKAGFFSSAFAKHYEDDADSGNNGEGEHIAYQGSFKEEIPRKRVEARGDDGANHDSQSIAAVKEEHQGEHAQGVDDAGDNGVEGIAGDCYGNAGERDDESNDVVPGTRVEGGAHFPGMGVFGG